MAGEWQAVTLGDVADTRNGAGIKQDHFSVKGVPLARVSDFTDESIDMSGCIHVDLAHAKRWESHRLKQGDVVVATVGSWPPNWSSVVGKSVRVPESAAGAIQNQNTCCVIARPGVTDQRFLFYLLRTETFVHYAANAAAGSANQARLPVASLGRYQVSLPPLQEQRAIAHILGSLDDKIELNRQMNKTLEAIARAMFKSWFVDFEPVPGIGPHKEWEDSPLGRIPKGWKVGVVGDIAKQSIGGQWGADHSADGLVPSICLRGCDMEVLRTGGCAPFAPIRFVKPKSVETRLPTDADVLIAASGAGPCGRPLWCSPLLHDLYEVPVIYSNFVKRLTTPSAAHAVYLDRVLIHKFEERTIHDYINGTSVPNLDTAGLLADCPILIPSDAVLGAFLSSCQPIYGKLYSQENVTLAAIRDALLPKLLSGEIPIRDAERIVGKEVR